MKLPHHAYDPRRTWVALELLQEKVGAPEKIMRDRGGEARIVGRAQLGDLGIYKASVLSLYQLKTS